MLRMGINEVRELSNVNEVNDFLKKGWKLLDTYHGEKGYVYVLCVINIVCTNN